MLFLAELNNTFNLWEKKLLIAKKKVLDKLLKLAIIWLLLLK
jgi:hypothetical protein